jgi:hypothetical protein
MYRWKVLKGLKGVKAVHAGFVPVCTLIGTGTSQPCTGTMPGTFVGERGLATASSFSNVT